MVRSARAKEFVASHPELWANSEGLSNLEKHEQFKKGWAEYRKKKLVEAGA
jgi:hypothetical protein